MDILKKYIYQVRGVSYKPSDVCDNEKGVPILRAGNICDNRICLDDIVCVDISKIRSEQFLRDGDVLICASSGSKSVVGKAAIYKLNNFISAFGAFCKVVRIKEDENVLADFIRLYFSSKFYREQISNKSQGANINNIKAEDIDSLLINIPDIQTQNIAVSELDKIQAALDNKKDQLKKLDELIQSKFYEMFGDPVVNDKGWEEHKLVEIVASNCSLSYGIVQPGEDVNDGIPIVRPVDFNKDIFVYRKNLKKIKKEISDAYKRTILKGDEILFCVRGTTGTMGLATKELVGCNVTRGIVPIYFESNQNKLFHFYQLLSPRLQKEIADKTNGAALKQINIKDLKQLLMYTPPLPLQQAFAAYVEKVEQAKAIVNQEIAHLQELLDSRMDFYFRK